MKRLPEALFAVLFAGMLSGLFSSSCIPHVTPPGGEDCQAACERLGPNNADHPHGLDCLSNGGRTPLGVECKVWLCESATMTAARSSCLSHAASCAAAKDCE